MQKYFTQYYRKDIILCKFMQSLQSWHHKITLICDLGLCLPFTMSDTVYQSYMLYTLYNKLWYLLRGLFLGPWRWTWKMLPPYLWSNAPERNQRLTNPLPTSHNYLGSYELIQWSHFQIPHVKNFHSSTTVSQFNSFPWYNLDIMPWACWGN